MTLGNMAYHNDSLCGELRKAVPLLSKLLSDPVSKIRYNSIGKLTIDFLTKVVGCPSCKFVFKRRAKIEHIVG